MLLANVNKILKINQSLSNMRFKKNQLIALIREWGASVGEDKEFTEQYAQEQADAWGTTEDRLDQAINCFKMLLHK